MNRLIALWSVVFAMILPDAAMAQFRDQDEVERHEERREHNEDADEHEDEDEDIGLSTRDVLTFIGKHMPYTRKTLDRLKRTDPEEYEERLEYLTEDIECYYEAREEQPRLAVMLLETMMLENRCRELVATLNRTRDPKEREILKKQLRGKLSQIFDLRMKEREEELRELEAEAAELKGLLEKRAKNRDRIIDRRFNELTEGEDDDLEWW